MKRLIQAALRILCALLLAMPECAAAIAVPITDDEALHAPRLYTIATVVGEENVPCYYYPTPEANAETAIGYFYPGTQLPLLETGEDWCRFSLVISGYIQTEHLALSGTQTTGYPETHGYAFVTFSPEDPALQSADCILFLPFLADCDPDSPGDPATNGLALDFVGFCGDMVQLKCSNSNGFLHRKHVHLLLDEDLFTGWQTAVTTGEYRTGKDFPAGLYRAGTDGGGDAAVTLTGAGGKMISHRIENSADVFVTLYIPPDTSVSLSAHAVLHAVPETPMPRQAVYPGGRILPGVDGDFNPTMDWNGLCTIQADNTPDAEYILSTLWNDKLLEAGEPCSLAPGETRIIRLRAGELIELHNCHLIDGSHIVP